MNISQAEAEEIVLAANRQEPYKLLTSAIRPSGIIGEGDRMAVHQMMKIYREGKTKIQVGDNNNLFDFTYVGNVAHAHLLAAEALLRAAKSVSVPAQDDRVDGEAFFITNGTPIYFWDFPRAIWNAAGAHGLENPWVLSRDVGLVLGYLSEFFFGLIGKPPTFNRQRIVFSCMTRYFDISKAIGRLGYEPLYTLEEGIIRSVAWFLAQENEQDTKGT
jgi:sterol-4alpha-carboxylate 3-dehydrogenase (decarboxylating)